MRISPTPAVSFTLALIATIALPHFLPSLHLFFFVPYLVICFYKYSLFHLLWRACLCGVIIDLLSSQTLFGFTSLNYCLVTLLLYGQKRNFFEDKLSTLPLMTFLFSFLSTLIALLVSVFFDQRPPLSLLWIATDLIGMSIVDAIYALLVFSLPIRLLSKLLPIRLFR